MYCAIRDLKLNKIAMLINDGVGFLSDNIIDLRIRADLIHQRNHILMGMSGLEAIDLTIRPGIAQVNPAGAKEKSGYTCRSSPFFLFADLKNQCQHKSRQYRPYTYRQFKIAISHLKSKVFGQL